MKKNDPVRRKNYVKFLIREEEKANKIKEKTKEKRDLKEAISGIANSLNLEDSIEINMDGPKKIISRRSHEVTMKKKIRKWKKEPLPADAMDEYTEF
ncbi:unnamed protein product [Blepharisma stoltei]|uniref:Uncharacterized protein n=1 Tax=Blepharisma stoltei TaxID=1481888 RepID=A0AAU9ILT2_9CILI|nr:unnamed protein product [Blepharisma stoltei]